ncbi:MAG: hypothetical protein DMG82_07140 [Acidobacteria bacterium]|nr:MAG: hypothetical protein DMG82_07140 [Acidobacteriota bacterium]
MIRGIDKLSQDQAISKWQVVGLEQISGQALAFSDEAIAAEREALDMVRSSFGVEYLEDATSCRGGRSPSLRAASRETPGQR